jgi:hypothetical protein
MLAATAKAVGAFGLAELVLPHDLQEAGGLVGGAALGMHRLLVAGQLTATALVAAAALATAASNVRMFARPFDDPEPEADKPDGELGKPKAYRKASCLYGMYAKPILAPCVRAAGAPLGNYNAKCTSWQSLCYIHCILLQASTPILSGTCTTCSCREGACCS